MKKRWMFLLITGLFILIVLLLFVSRSLLISNGLRFFGTLGFLSEDTVNTIIENFKNTGLEEEGDELLNAHGYRYTKNQLFLSSSYRIIFIVLCIVLLTLFLCVFLYYRQSEEKIKTLQEKEEDLSKQCNALEESHEAVMQKVSEYQGNIYHQLASSLSSVRISLESLPEEKETASTIQEAEFNLSGVNQLLKLLMKEEKYLEKKQNFHYEPFSFSELLEEVTEEDRSLLTFHEIRFTENIEEDLILCGDDVWLKECFLSLFTNAIEHAGENGMISLSAKKVANTIRVHLWNNGIPLTAEQQEHLFERYYSNKPGHMGIGMHMAYSVIEQHHGTIEISNEDDGVAITVLLPILFGEDAY